MKVITCMDPLHYLPAWVCGLELPQMLLPLQFAEHGQLRENYAATNLTIMQPPTNNHHILAVLLAMLPTPLRSAHIPKRKFIDTSLIVVERKNLVVWRNFLKQHTLFKEARDYQLFGDQHLSTQPTTRRPPLFYVVSDCFLKRFENGLTFKRVIVDGGCIMRKIPNGLHTHVLTENYATLVGNNCIWRRWFQNKYDPDRTSLMDPITDVLVT